MSKNANFSLKKLLARSYSIYLKYLLKNDKKACKAYCTRGNCLCYLYVGPALRGIILTFFLSDSDSKNCSGIHIWYSMMKLWNGSLKFKFFKLSGLKRPVPCVLALKINGTTFREAHFLWKWVKLKHWFLRFPID